MKKSTLAIALALVLGSSSALAGKMPPLYSLVTTTSGSTSKNNTNAYAGLNWSLGSSWTPALVLGVFQTKVKSDGDTQGANLSFHLNLAGGIKPGKLKLSYLNGREKLQGELGIGYDFIRSSPLLGLGVNGPFVAAGIDGYLSHGVVPYVTLQSQGKFSKPSFQNATNCVQDDISGIYDDNTCTNLFGPL